VKLVLSEKRMDIGTAEFNFMRTLMVAGTGGAEVSECLLVVERIRQNDEESWVREWARTAEQLRRAAEAAASAGQPVTARQAYFRASNYFRTAMFSLPRTDDRLDRYLTASRECFHEAAQLSSPRIEIVAIPFGGASLPGYFLSADPRFAGPRPTLLALNGGDSTNEELVHWLGFAAVARGWNFMVFEGPGQWSALQLNPGLVLRPDYEVPVKAVIAALAQRDNVDTNRIALFGPSLGSLLAARVAAFDERIAACVCDGLVVDVHEAWRAVWPLPLRLAPADVFDAVFGALERLSPQLKGLTNHFRWMLGAAKPHEIIDAWKPYCVRDLAPRIRCPVLMLYGQAEAAQSNENVALSAMNFMSRLTGPAEVRLFGFDQGWAASHCQIGAPAPMQAVVFDWLERAVTRPNLLPRRALGENVRPILSRSMRSARARRTMASVLQTMSRA
jgi:pimeloyl-ACP methyl ester carboxylesterase